MRLKVFYLAKYIFRSVLEVWIDAFDLSLTLCLDADFTVLCVFPPYKLWDSHDSLTDSDLSSSVRIGNLLLL